MATGVDLSAHIDAITSAAATAVKTAAGDRVIVRDRPACNVSDAIVEAVRVASVGRDYSDVPD